MLFDMVESISSAASGITTALDDLDSAARAISRPPARPVPRDEEPIDLNGQRRVSWPIGSVFAPGLPQSDARGLVAWPGLDGQVLRFLAQRSVQANATVIRQARASYEAIAKMAS